MKKETVKNLDRIIKTNINDSDRNIVSILNYMSVQLSDGYWEGDEGYFEELWNWLDFENRDDKLIVIVKATPTWNVEDIFSSKTNSEIINYLGRALRDTYESYPSVYSEYEDVDKIIDILENYHSLNNNSEIKDIKIIIDLDIAKSRLDKSMIENKTKEEIVDFLFNNELSWYGITKDE